MTRSARPERERFRDLVRGRLGLVFDDGKLAFLGDVLEKRLDATGSTFAEYEARMLRGADRGELEALGGELTVGETYFFRNVEQLRALVDVALPDRRLLAARRGPLRILCAGCASGEEAYTLAMLLDAALVPPGEATVLAVDVNAAALARAARGRYSAWALRATPPDARERWFRCVDGAFAPVEGARARVTFAWRNLADEAAADPAETFDVIFCRNVVMYLDAETARRVVERLARALAPGGYLFLGHAETLRGLSRAFHLRHTHGAFYYQKRDGAGAAGASIGPPGAALAGFGEVAPPTTDTSWFEEIRRAAERVRVLTDSPTAPPVTGRRPPDAPEARLGADLEPALEMLRGERFAEALALVGRLPESTDDRDALLLRAALLVHTGDLATAETACRDLLARDELNAGAHYVLALCREGARDAEGAADHDRIAIHLDPAFAMPRLHLGLVSRRSGDADGARRELGRALALLEHEDASRVLLFGGGFDRAALVALCRAELAASGARP